MELYYDKENIHITLILSENVLNPCKNFEYMRPVVLELFYKWWVEWKFLDE